jgi:hypothetical protein
VFRILYFLNLLQCCQLLLLIMFKIAKTARWRNLSVNFTL